jgi:hypothetical protein
MIRILSSSLILLLLGACTTLQHIAPGRGAANATTSPTSASLAGNYDNHEQVWSARASSGVIAPPHVVVTIEATPKGDWSVWHVHYDATPALDATWAMKRIGASDERMSLVTHRPIVDAPASAAAFDEKQWAPLDACALHGNGSAGGIHVAADAVACAAIVPGIGALAALLPLAIEREGEWLHVRLYADQARGVDTREDTRKVETYAGWTAINGSGPSGGGSGNDWHTNRSMRLGSEGSRAGLTWRDGKPSGYSLGLERVTYREGNIPVLKLSVIDDSNGATLGYAWANPEATRIGINIGWVQVGLERVADPPK